MRSSVITTFDNIEIIIPNSTLMQNNVINLTFFQMMLDVFMSLWNCLWFKYR